jgi:adenylate kinase family enzyme
VERPWNRNIFVLVAGPPGSGKTRLAISLADKLGLPLIAKDVIKEMLMDTLGVPATVEESRTLGRAAVEVMLTVAQTSRGAVLDSTFYSYTVPSLQTLPGSIIEIRCRCPRALALSRYRARSAGRHRGHLDAERTDDELWDEQLLRPLGLGPLIEVDTTGEVDIDSLQRQLRQLVPR